MRHIGLTITFTDGNGAGRRETHVVEACDPPDPGAEHREAHILLTELKVTVGEQAAPKHNATARAWLEFPNQPARIEEYFDIQNSQAVWLELANLVMGAEGDLILAQTLKALEPPSEPPFSDTTATNDLYYVHDRKMNLLNQSVHAVIKVQDLVNRLLHESLGGDLVDTSDPDWETQLTRKKVNRGLKAKLDTGAISPSNFDAVTQALAIPENTPKGQTALAYRNRLAHHIRPSVDYSMFFSALESRAGEELTAADEDMFRRLGLPLMRDAQGKGIARRHSVSARPPVQYRFQDLYAAFSEYLDALVAMLQQLSQINILRR
jgi:hypothetical protein